MDISVTQNGVPAVVATRVPGSNGAYHVSAAGIRIGTVKLSGFPGQHAKWEARFAGVSTFHRTKVQAIEALARRAAK